MSAAEYIREPDKVPYTLIKDFYTTPQKNYEGWMLTQSTSRIGVYKRGDDYFILLRGTDVTDINDIKDDLRIGGLIDGEVTLVTQGREVITRLLQSTTIDHLKVGGHSLGGYAALVIGGEYGINTVAFNPAAPVFKPTNFGPGPGKAVVYHIGGDPISTSVNPLNAEIIRVDCGYGAADALRAHSMNSFSADTQVYGFMTHDQEDLKLVSEAATWSYYNMKKFFPGLKPPPQLYTVPPIFETTIPGASRDPNGEYCQLFTLKDAVCTVISKANSFDYEVRLVQYARGVEQTGLGLGYGFGNLLKNIIGAKRLKVLETSVNLGQQVAKFIGTGELVLAGDTSAIIGLLTVPDDIDTLRRQYAEAKTAFKEYAGTAYEGENIIATTSKGALSKAEVLKRSILNSCGITDEVLANLSIARKIADPATRNEFLLGCAKEQTSAALAELQLSRLAQVEEIEMVAVGSSRVAGQAAAEAVVVGGRASQAAEAALATYKGLTVAGEIYLGVSKVFVGALHFVGVVGAVITVLQIAYAGFLAGVAVGDGNWDPLLQYVTGLNNNEWNHVLGIQAPVKKIEAPKPVLKRPLHFLNPVIFKNKK